MHLANVDRLVIKIIMFWENMAATYNYLKDDFMCGTVYLRKLEHPKFVHKIKESVARSQQVPIYFDMNTYLKICFDYWFNWFSRRVKATAIHLNYRRKDLNAVLNYKTDLFLQKSQFTLVGHALHLEAKRLMF